MVEILFFDANTVDNDPLSVGREIRTIEEKLRMVETGRSWKVTPVMAVRPEDWRLRLNMHHPDIVHFSGHGSELGKLLLVGEKERAQAVEPEAFKRLFQIFKGKIRLVVLNACNSSKQAQAISEDIDCTIGIDGEVADPTSIAFAGALYQGLALGHSVQSAFEQAILDLQLHRLKGVTQPKLFVRSGVDANQVWLVEQHLRKEEKKELSIFYIYVPEEKKFCVELEKYFSVIRRKGWIRSYYGEDLKGGTLEQQTVMQQLYAAQIILLIVSPSLMASPIYKEQVEPAWELRKQQGALVIPVIVKPVPDWKQTEFGDLVSLPREKPSVSAYGSSGRERALYDIAEHISKIIKDMHNE